MLRFPLLGRSTRKYFRKNSPSRPGRGSSQLRQVISRSGTAVIGASILTSRYFAPQWGQVNGEGCSLGKSFGMYEVCPLSAEIASRQATEIISYPQPAIRSRRRERPRNNVFRPQRREVRPSPSSTSIREEAANRGGLVKRPSSAVYQQGTHLQHPRGAHALIQPGPHPQAPVPPLHAASLTISVAFLSAWSVSAPRSWLCAPAVMVIVASTSAVVAKVKVNFRIRSSFR